MRSDSASGSTGAPREPAEPAPELTRASTEDVERRLVRRDEEREHVVDCSALVDLLNFYRREGREDAIRKRLRRFIADVGAELEVRAWCCVVLGQSCERRREYEAAIDNYRQGIACEPCRQWTAYFLHNNLGYCLNVVGRPAEAEWYCRTAIRIDGTRANAAMVECRRAVRLAQDMIREEWGLGERTE